MFEISGQVLDSNGFSVENATVSLAGIGKFALTDEQGFFTIPGIPSGTYYIMVVQRNYDQLVTKIAINRDISNLMLTMS